jgi:hypothetical protein
MMASRVASSKLLIILLFSLVSEEHLVKILESLRARLLLGSGTLLSSVELASIPVSPPQVFSERSSVAAIELEFAAPEPSSPRRFFLEEVSFHEEDEADELLLLVKALDRLP